MCIGLIKNLIWEGGEMIQGKFGSHNHDALKYSITVRICNIKV